jgi:hypothetical protein
MGWWSSLKRAVKRVVKAVASYVVEAVNRILRLPNTIMTWFGYLPIKNLKLRILILRGSNGAPVADAARVRQVVDRAKQILRDSARINLTPTSGEFVWTVNEIAPAAALRLRGPGGGIVLDQLGEAGEFFDTMIGKYHSKATFPYNLLTTPITGFIVEDIDGVDGVASAIAGNWFAVRVAGLEDVVINTFESVTATVVTSIMAHELGHNMGLSLIVHHTDPANLMFPDDGRGLNLTQGQLTIARSARCVSFW